LEEQSGRLCYLGSGHTINILLANIVHLYTISVCGYDELMIG